MRVICFMAWALLVGMIVDSQGAIVNARSMSRSDVGSAVSSAREGDTILVPPGTADWKQALVIGKSVTLQFAGVGQSVITDDIGLVNGGNPGSTEAVIALEPSNPKALARITGLQINRGISPRLGGPFFKGTLQIIGHTRNVRIDHCLFTNVNSDNIYVYDACPLIDHCAFYAKSANLHAICVAHTRWANSEYGDGSWTTPAELGTSNAVYIEDCNFTGPQPATPYCAVDAFNGARYVFRYNHVTNSWVTCHGTESTAYNRGTRSMEIYLNDFSDPFWYCCIEFRSATGVVWSNTAAGYKNFCRLSDYRVSDSYKFWGAANGMNPLDKNAEGGPFLTVAHGGENQSKELVVSGANWTPNQWRGYSAIDVSERSPTNFGMIYSNTTDTAYLMVTAIHPHILFHPGDTVKFYKVVSALDMPGMGQSEKLKRSGEGDPRGPWPNQAIEPIYAWGNTMNGARAELTSSPIILEGTHYFNDTPKPGYQPLTYPHPLALQ